MPKIFTDNEKRYFCEVAKYLQSVQRPKFQNTRNHFAEKYPNNKILQKAAMQRMEKWVIENPEDKIVIQEFGKKNTGESDQKRITKTDQKGSKKDRTNEVIKAIDEELKRRAQKTEIGSETDHKNGSNSDQKKDQKILKQYSKFADLNPAVQDAITVILFETTNRYTKYRYSNYLEKSKIIQNWKEDVKNE